MRLCLIRDPEVENIRTGDATFTTFKSLPKRYYLSMTSPYYCTETSDQPWATTPFPSLALVFSTALPAPNTSQIKYTYCIH